MKLDKPIDVHMSDKGVCFSDATRLAGLIRTREVSPLEVIQAHLDRIEAVNPKINAVVTLLAEDAIRAAKAAEAAVMSGVVLGPFHGVPFSIKDSIDTAGILTQRGSKLFAGNVPDRDATAVARMRDAGAIPLMKTNVPEFSGWWETDNLVTGRTNNPWNLERTPGGSSGGEAAAIAAGLSPMGLGSDVGISVRGPAALTGIVALKATHGQVPYTGHWPEALSRFWHIGPMARTVRDVAAAFGVLKGPDGIDGHAIYARDAMPAHPPQPGQPLRIGWLVEPAFGPVDAEVAAAVASAAQLLESFGCEVEQVRMPILEQVDCTQLAATLFADLVPYLRPFIAGHEAELSAIGLRSASRPEPSFEEYVGAEARVETLKSAFAGYFQRYDVLLCPVIAFTAPPHGQKEYEVNGQKVPTPQMMRATLPFNLTGLPALSVPFRFSSDGLPIGVQLVGSWLDEATILRLGALIEAASDVRSRQPDL